MALTQERIYTIDVISNHISSKGGECEPFIAPFAVLLNENERLYDKVVQISFCQCQGILDCGS